MKRIKILIANKYFLMNFAIRCILKNITGFDVFGVQEENLLTGIKKVKPDLLIIETDLLKLNSPLRILEIKKQFPELKILVLLDLDNKNMFYCLLQLKLDGYLLKRTSRDELVECVTCIHKGKKYLSKAIRRYLIENLTDQIDYMNKKLTSGILSLREKEILQLIALGKNNKEIAGKLFISPNTVLTHRRNIMKKLDTKNAAQLIIKGIQQGFVTIKD